MIDRIARSRRFGGLAAVATLAVASGSAQAADIMLTDAKIAGGLLLVSGTTAVPNTEVRLDGQPGTAFNVTSDARRSFAFRLVYHPGDCIVTLQRVVPPYGALGAPIEGLVADCGRDGVSWRGGWSEGVPYAASDLVTHEGSAWRARRNNLGRAPAEGADWEIFALGAGAEAAEAEMAAARVPPSGPAGGDLQGNYPDPQIRNLTIVASNLASDAVTNPKINNGAVTGDKILDGAIGNADIADDAVDSASILGESITSSDLATNSVNATEIANDSIDSGEIVNDSLIASDLAAASVGSSELQDGAVGSAELASNAVTGSKVASNSLTTADIAGADVNGGGINIPTGYVPNGRCRQVDANVGGATAGEAVIFSVKAALQDGILIYGQRVPSNGHVTFSVCNFSGTTQAAISGLPVRIVTFN